MKANIYSATVRSFAKRMACTATICGALLSGATAQTPTTGTVYSNFPDNQAATNVIPLAPTFGSGAFCSTVGTVLGLIGTSPASFIVQNGTQVTNSSMADYAELGSSALLGIDLTTTLNTLGACVTRDYYEITANLYFPSGDVAPGGYYAGFRVAFPGVVGNLNLGSATVVTTLYNGTVRETINGSALGLNLLGEGLANLQFQTSSAPNNFFNQVRIKFAAGIASIGALSSPPRVYYAYASPMQILPVKISSFSAINEGKGVRLNWASATEVNVSHYELERSTTATGKFEKIGAVNAKGNSTSATSYTFNDNAIVSSEYFYRLKMVDKDGSFEYSSVASIRNLVPSKIKIYPTLLTKGQNILVATENNSATKTDIQLTSLQGQVLKTISTSDATISIATGNLNAGIYVLKLYRNGQLAATEKVVVQ